MRPVLTGRSALITGASQGLGLEIARAYVREGADVFICARDAVALAAATDGLRAAATDGQQVHSSPADVSDPAAVDALLAEASTQLPGLDVLVNNAGVYGPKGSIWDVDWAEWVRAIEINLLGSVLVSRAMAAHLRAQGRPGKIVQLSGGGATTPLPGLSAYAASKAGIIRFVETLALELRDDHVDVNAIAPGALNTQMLDEVLAAGPEKVGAAFYERSVAQAKSGGTPLQKGADLAVYLASAASDGVTGKLISAVWDPYAEFADHAADLDTDIYTLRRIVPGDRGMNWGD